LQSILRKVTAQKGLFEEEEDDDGDGVRGAVCN
jgi:hypothetical protein